MLASPGSRNKIWEEVLSICLSIYLSTNNKLWALLKNKIRDICIKKCFVRSLNCVLLLLWLYNICSHVLDIKFANAVLDLLSIINSYNENVTLQ